MNNNDKCRSNNNSNDMILHRHCRFLQPLISPRAVMIYGMPVKTYNAPQNYIIVLLYVMILNSDKLQVKI